MNLAKIPKDTPVYGVFVESYDSFENGIEYACIGVFEHIRDAAYFCSLAGVKTIIEPHHSTALDIRGVTVTPKSPNCCGYY